MPKDRRVALLRGINVGTAKRVAMADLRKLFERLGYEDVKTLLNSGNVVFTVTKKSGADGAKIESEIAKRLGVTTRVTLIGAKELAAAVRSNPLQSVADNPSRLLLLVMSDARTAAKLEPLTKQSWKPEALALVGRVAYVWCANGLLESRIWASASKLLGDAVTARNIATMTKLSALVDEP